MPLEVARREIAVHEAWRALELRVIETAPPFVSKHHAPIWGDWRVVRVTQTEKSLELLVARELLGEEKLVADF